MIVVDASLAAKWMLRERDSAAAVRFLEVRGMAITAPRLIVVEVAGAIVRHANERKLERADADRALTKWTVLRSERSLGDHEVTDHRLAAASRLALDLGHPLKDCVYLALGIELDCELATCDGRFAERAVSRGHRVRLLADYE